MATIQVNGEWRVTGDEHSWQVEWLKRWTSKDGEPQSEWRTKTYHQTLSAAAKSLALRRIRTAEVEGVGAVLDEWESIAGEIDAAFERWKEAS